MADIAVQRTEIDRSVVSNTGRGHATLSVQTGAESTKAVTPAAPTLSDKPREAWLPPQWKKPEDLLGSYKELQGAYTRSQQELATLKATAASTTPSTNAASPPAPAPIAAPNADLTAVAAAALAGTAAASTGTAGSTPAPSPAPSSATSGTPIDESIDPVDLKALSKEWAEQGGKLSDASVARLKRKGLTLDTIAEFVEARQALSRELVRPVVEAAGGEERMALVLKWHGDLKTDLGARYNQALADDNLRDAAIVMQSMNNAYQQAVGRDPRLAISGVEARAIAAEEPFQTMSELTSAQSDRRYGKDMTYTNSVIRRGMGLGRLMRSGQAR